MLLALVLCDGTLLDDVELRGLVVRCGEEASGPPLAPCRPATCAAAFFSEWPAVAFRGDVFAPVRCDACRGDGNATGTPRAEVLPAFCSCVAPAIGTAAELHDAGLDGALRVTLWGDSTARNAVVPLTHLAFLAASAASNASFDAGALYEGGVVRPSRAALAAYEAAARRGGAAEKEAPLQDFFGRAAGDPNDRNTSYMYFGGHDQSHPHFYAHPDAREAYDARGKDAAYASREAVVRWDSPTYKGLEEGTARLDRDIANARDRPPDRSARRFRTHLHLVNAGAHLLHRFRAEGYPPTRPPDPRAQFSQFRSFRADLADAFHAKVRYALAAGELGGTVLAWRATGYVCRGGLYGEWLSNANAAAGALTSHRSPASGVCEAFERAAWAAAGAPPWGDVSLAAACARGNMGPRGGEYTNELADGAVRHLNRCYFDDDVAALPPGFPCPDDLRGVANRTTWRLPGVYFLAYNTLSQSTCGQIRHSDGIHVDQVVLPMLRSFLAAVQ